MKKTGRNLFLLSAIIIAAILCVSCKPAAKADLSFATASELSAAQFLEIFMSSSLSAQTAVIPAPEPELLLSGYVIGIDPGHQGKSNHSLEPQAHGSNTMKAKVSSGTQGRFTRVPEYKVNLSVGLLLKELLEEQGATVVMTREVHDINISNIERAQLFNEKKTDYALRLHCNGSNDSKVNGAFI